MRTWRVVPAVSSALLVLVATLVALTILESSQTARTADLGLTGEGLRVVVMRPGDVIEDDLSGSLMALASQERLSVAYAASDLTGFVTVLDAYGRFGDGRRSFREILPPPGAGPSAAVSDAVTEAASLEPVLAEQSQVVGSFHAPGVVFEGRRPAVVYNVDAVPFDEGYYLIAGDHMLAGRLPDRVVDVFDDHGMVIVEGSGLGRSLTGLVGSAYGLVVLLLSGIVVVNHLVILAIDAALARDRWLVLATLGADRRGVRTGVRARLWQHVLVGGTVGAALAASLAVLVQDLAQAPAPQRLAAVVASLALMGVTSAAIIGVVGWREGRWVARAVPG